VWGLFKYGLPDSLVGATCFPFFSTLAARAGEKKGKRDSGVPSGCRLGLNNPLTAVGGLPGASQLSGFESASNEIKIRF